MKKIIAIVSALILTATAASAQGGLLGDLLNTYTTISLTGNWTYNGVATAISSDNTLVTLASSAYKTKLETKINGYLSKVGIKPGSAVSALLADANGLQLGFKLTKQN